MAEIDEQQIQDPTTQGTSGLRGLKGLNEQENNEVTIFDLARDYRGAMSKIYQNHSPKKAIGVAGINDSMFDKNITSESQLADLNNTRGELQPWYAQIGAGLFKGGVIAVTTLADGLAGSLFGIANIIGAAANGEIDSWRDVGDKFISNPWSVALQSINEWAEDVAPSYYTNAELNSPWYENIFTANFIGDKFIKNLGFTIGAAYSGRISTGVLSKAMGLNKVRDAFKGTVTTLSGRKLNTASEIAKAYKSGDAFMDGVKLTDDLGKAAKKLRNAEYGLRTLGAVNAAMGEGRIEAITNSQQYYDYHKQLLDDQYNKEKQEIEQDLFKEHPEYFGVEVTGDGVGRVGLNQAGREELERRADALNNKYEEALAKLNADRAKLANRTFAANVAMLSASNLYSYGRFLGGGYKLNRQAKNLTKSHIRGKYAKAATVPLVETNEEMTQSAIPEAIGQKYASELNDFWGAKIDPDAEEETIEWMTAVGKGISNTYGNPDNWERGFLGAITGGVGMPHVSMRRNESGKKRPKLTIEGELWENIREARKLSKEAKDINEEMNNRLKDPEFLNYYQGMIRHKKFENDMNDAVDKGDEFNFKNAESSQLVSDAIMFDKAGRLQDLYNTIEEAGNVTIEDVEGIREQTTKRDGSPSVYDSMTDEQVVDYINKQARAAKKKVDKYVEISNNLKTLYGDNIDSDTLEELTWMMTQIDDWEKRTKNIISEIKDPIIDRARELKDKYDINVGDAYKAYWDSNIEDLLKYVAAEDDTNLIDRINKIINDKNISVEEGRKKIEDEIRAAKVERRNSGLALGRKIRSIQRSGYREWTAAKDKWSQRVGEVTKNLTDKDNKISFAISDAKQEYKQAVSESLKSDSPETQERLKQAYSNLVEAIERGKERLSNEEISRRAEESAGELRQEMSDVSNKYYAKEYEVREEQRETSAELLNRILDLKDMLESSEYQTTNPLDTSDLINKIQDLIKLYVARASFIDKYTALSEHPELFTKEAKEQIKKVTEQIRNKEVTTALDNIGYIEDIKELRKVLNTLDGDIIDDVLAKYSERGKREKELVEEYNKLNDYGKSLIETIGIIPPEEGDMAASLYALITSAIDVSNSVEDLKSILEDGVYHVPKNVAEKLKEIIDKASKNLKSKKAAGKKDTNKPTQEPKKSEWSIDKDFHDSNEDSSRDYGEVEGADNRSNKPKRKANPVDNSNEKSSKVSDIEEKSTEELKEIAEGKVPSNIPDKDKPKVKKLAAAIVKNREIPDGDSQAEGTNSEDNNPKKEQVSVGNHLRSWYHTKYRFDELKDRDIRRAERYNSPVVDALDELGAFDFVDEGNLGVLFNNDNHIPIHYIKSKDKRLKNVVVLAIEVTPEVESLVKIPNPITAQNGKKYQAVGALSFPKDNQAAANGYNVVITGLSEEIDEYLENNSEPDYFVSERQSNEIQHIYSGRMVKTTTNDAPRQKPLKELTTNPILGIYYGNSPIPRVPMLSSNEEIVPLNSNNANPRDGSVWLMSREADGRWYAKAVQVRRFTADEYDIDEHYNTPIMQAIIQDLRIIADPNKTDYDRAIAKYDLMNILYFPEGVNILFNEDSISIQGFQNNIGKGLSIDEKVQALLEALQDESLNLRFQVDPNSLSERLYVKDLLDSDILTTDLAMVHNINASFDLKIPDAQGNLKDEKVNPTGHTGRKGINNTITSMTVTVNGEKYSITEEGVITDSKGNTINDQKSLDEITAVSAIREGLLNPVEGNNRLYLGIYSTTGEQFGVIGNHIVTGEKLDSMLKRAEENVKKKERKQNLNKAFGSMEQAPDEELAELGYEIDNTSEVQQGESSILDDKKAKEKGEVNPTFNIGDRVHFDTGNKKGNGVITRVSSTGKMFEVQEDGGRKTMYMASLLTKLEEQDVDESLFEEPIDIAEEPASAGIFANREFHKPNEPKNKPKENEKSINIKPEWKEMSPEEIIVDYYSHFDEYVNKYDFEEYLIELGYFSGEKSIFGGMTISASTGNKMKILNVSWDYIHSLFPELSLTTEQVDTGMGSTKGLLVVSYKGKGYGTPDNFLVSLGRKNGKAQKVIKEIEADRETTKSKPKGPISIGESFNEENTPSVKELSESKNNPDFKRLARTNRKRLAEVGFKNVQELEDFINDPKNKMPAIETIDSQDKFSNLLDIIANCR